MKNFEIVTLSDHNENQYGSLGQLDPIGGIIKDIFGLFGGGGRRKLNAEDWREMFPANGEWTNKLRRYLSNTIHYNVDLGNVEQFTAYFADENRRILCTADKLTPSGGQISGCALKKLMELLNSERSGKPIVEQGIVPSPYQFAGAFNINAYLPFIIGGVLLLFFINKK